MSVLEKYKMLIENTDPAGRSLDQEAFLELAERLEALESKKKPAAKAEAKKRKR